MSAVAEFLHRANYIFKYGTFQLDYDSGKIGYTVFVDCSEDCESVPSESVSMRSLEMPIHVFEDFGDRLLSVMNGEVRPTEAIIFDE